MWCAPARKRREDQSATRETARSCSEEREREGMADQDSVVEEIAKLNVDQLRQVKEQVESELSVLQDSLVNIRTAATRFEMASKALNTLSLQPAGTSIHPLSHSRLVLLAISGFELSLLRFLWFFLPFSVLVLLRGLCFFLDPLWWHHDWGCCISDLLPFSCIVHSIAHRQ